MARTTKQPLKKQIPAKKTASVKKKNQNLAGEAAGVFCIAVGILLAAFLYFSYDALVAEWCRVLIFGLFGVIGYLVPLLVIGLGVLFIINIDIRNRNTILAGSALWLVMAFTELCSVRVYAAGAIGFFPYLGQCFTNGRAFTGGGICGGLIAYPAELLLGKIGGLILIGAMLLITIMLITHFSIRDAATALSGRIRDASVSAAEARRERNAARAERIKEKASDYDQVYEEAFSDAEESPEDTNREERRYINKNKEKTERTQQQVETEKLAEDKKARRRKEREVAVVAEKETELNLLNKEFGRERSYPSVSGKTEKIEMYPSEGSLESGFRKAKIRPRRDIKKNTGYTIVSPKVKDPVQQQLAEQYYDVAEVTEETTASRRVMPVDVQDNQYFEAEPEIVSAEPAEAVNDAEAEEITDAIDESADSVMPKPQEKVYMLPERLDLLDDPPYSNHKEQLKNENRSKALRLEQTLKNFNIDIKVHDIVAGPTVTRYELLPTPGLKVKSILNLADDIALSLAAASVRIEAPIPGKSAIGIEVPNDKVETVKIKELLEAEEFKKQKSNLYFALGKDITGKYIYGDLAKMPHLLVAGTTGSGKSVCINSIIMSILYKSSPEEVNLLMVDPKVVEMKRFNGIPHMKTAVVTDPKKATSMLNWVVNEMLKRYKDFADANVKEIDSYNELRRKQSEKILPKLVVIIDELADLMMASKHEVEDAICRIAQLGRAAGIHLVVATQTPRKEVVTGMIKTNISSRIALTVSSGLDSRIILDMNGAEDLLGHGDMLFMPIGQSRPTRLQGCYISDEESNRVIDFLKNSAYETQQDNELEKQLEEGVAPTGASAGSEETEAQAGGFDDELIPRAIELALEYEQLSSSMLMRRLKIGYARAARLVDELEMNEIVSPADGNKPRQILITYEDYRRMFGKEDT